MDDFRLLLDGNHLKVVIQNRSTPFLVIRRPDNLSILPFYRMAKEKAFFINKLYQRLRSHLQRLFAISLLHFVCRAFPFIVNIKNAQDLLVLRVVKCY